MSQSCLLSTSTERHSAGLSQSKNVSTESLESVKLESESEQNTRSEAGQAKNSRRTDDFYAFDDDDYDDRRKARPKKAKGDAIRMEEGDRSASFQTPKSRNWFIFVVYLLVGLCLLVCFAIILTIVVVEQFRNFFLSHVWVYWIIFIPWMFIYYAMVCYPAIQRKWPLNIILLILFSVVSGFLGGAISAAHETKTIVLTMGMTAAVVLIITIVAIISPVDITDCGCCICIVTLALLGVVAISFPIFYFFVDPSKAGIFSLVISSLFALLMCLYIFWQTQLIVGGRKVEIGERDYAFAAMILFTSIFELFLYLLGIMGRVQ